MPLVVVCFHGFASTSFWTRPQPLLVNPSQPSRAPSALSGPVVLLGFQYSKKKWIKKLIRSLKDSARAPCDSRFCDPTRPPPPPFQATGIARAFCENVAFFTCHIVKSHNSHCSTVRQEIVLLVNFSR